MIVSDYLRAYRSLTEEGYIHKVLNEIFRDSFKDANDKLWNI